MAFQNQNKQLNNDNAYESDDSLDMYLGFHYPYVALKDEETPPTMIPHENAPLHGLQFAQRVAQLLTQLVLKKTSGKELIALDLGCAVGGSSFELAKQFQHVDAIDYSHQFINAAKRIQKGEQVSFKIPLEANVFQTVMVQQPQENADRIRFMQGDATQLDRVFPQDEKYDGILLSNLLCRLADPYRCLQSLPTTDNGIVLMVSPYSWLEEYTHPSQWLGGYMDPETEDPLWSANQLQNLMKELGYCQILDEEVPCVIREHQRKYQYILSHAMAWQKQTNE